MISVNGADQVLHIEGGNMGSAWRNYASLLQKTQLIANEKCTLNVWTLKMAKL